MPIKGEVFARKDLVWVMSVCMGKICLFFFSFGNFHEDLFANGGSGCARETISRYWESDRGVSKLPMKQN